MRTVIRQNLMFDIRKFTQSDGLHCLRLFRDTVRGINANDYDATQISAWASADIDAHQWIARFTGRHALVAESAGRIIGFTDMSVTGFLDRMFVSADHQRIGVASALIQRLFAIASDTGIDTIHTDASITAHPFFAKVGFVGTTKQIVNLRGVNFTNYRMTYCVSDNHAMYRSGGDAFSDD